MHSGGRLRNLGGALVLVLALAACQGDAERAESHYQNALELQAAGDLDRARIEFLNVFNNVGNHRDARADFAAMLRDWGRIRESYSQYLRLVEQYPDDLDGRIALAEMALTGEDWEQGRLHGGRAIELAPEDPQVVVIAVVLEYAAATQEEDAPARRSAYDRAAALLEADPDNPILLRVAIDHAVREADLDGALATLDRLIALEPGNRRYHNMRLGLLIDAERAEAVEAQLLAMIGRFPSDNELSQMLLQFYLSQNRDAEAEAHLRELALRPDPDVADAALSAIVQLILERDGTDAALAALEDIIAEPGAASPLRFRLLHASIRYDRGETEAAIAEIEAILAEDLPAGEVSNVRLVLAQMLLASDNVVGARAQVELLLADDPTQTEALKMRAAWFIDGDQADEAIATLRIVLDEAPEDLGAMNLMADAYLRNGNRELAVEFLSLAADTSNNAPAPVRRYAEMLIEEGRELAAERVLISALRQAPDHPGILTDLGALYLQLEDWPRAEQVSESLRALDDPDAQRAAEQIQAQRLVGQGRIEEMLSLLESAADEADGADVQTQVAVISARLAAGDEAGAMSFAQELVAANPEISNYRFVLAALIASQGDLEAAEAMFRELTQDFPDQEQVWLGLLRLLNAQGRSDEAQAILETALEALPEALNLLWAQASFREQSGDVDGAIDIYELMYERAPNSVVVANNLASLIASYRTDDVSLERAWTVARRLRDAEHPAFQDTYGWIAYRRGEYEEALAHLEPAAARLPQDPLVQFHLGMTYAALGENTQALAVLQRALALAGDDSRGQFETARQEVARLQDAVAAQDEAGSE